MMRTKRSARSRSQQRGLGGSIAYDEEVASATLDTTISNTARANLRIATPPLPVDKILRACAYLRRITKLADLHADMVVALEQYKERRDEFETAIAQLMNFTKKEIGKINRVDDDFYKISERTIKDVFENGRFARYDATFLKFLIWICYGHFEALKSDGIADARYQHFGKLLTQAYASRRERSVEFPNSLETLQVFLESLSHRVPRHTPRLHIVSDCADPGSFFYPWRYETLFCKLVSLAKCGRRIRLLVCGPVQAITTAINLSNEAPKSRLRNSTFRAYLSQYCEYLRNENNGLSDESRTLRGFCYRCWLEQHATSHLKQLHDWIREFGPSAYRQVAKEDLGNWVRRAIDIVYGHADFSEAPDDLRALLALLWCRERYFEELLVIHGIDVRRAGSRPPESTLWLSETEAVFGSLSRTQPHRGWVNSLDIVADVTARSALLEYFHSTFYDFWFRSGAKRQPKPSWYAGHSHRCPHLA